MKNKIRIFLSGLIVLFVFFPSCKNKSEFANAEYVSLRSEFKQIDDFKYIKEIIYKYDFFDIRRNRSGGFKGRVREEKMEESTVLIDSKTGLMWMAQEKNDPSWLKLNNNIKWIKTFFYKDAERQIIKLNKSNNGYAGYRDWRLPTVVEAASLLRKKGKPNTLYLPEEFSIKNTPLLYIWTGDYYNLNSFKKKNMIWTVSFAAGGIFRESHTNPQYLRLVRKFKTN